MMPVTKVMPVYFASFSTENLKSLNVPGKKKERFYARAPTPPSDHLWYSRYCCLCGTHSKPGNLDKLRRILQMLELKETSSETRVTIKR